MNRDKQEVHSKVVLEALVLMEDLKDLKPFLNSLNKEDLVDEVEEESNLVTSLKVLNSSLVQGLEAKEEVNAKRHKKVLIFK